jgi:hypothetical protein
MSHAIESSERRGWGKRKRTSQLQSALCVLVLASAFEYGDVYALQMPASSFQYVYHTSRANVEPLRLSTYLSHTCPNRRFSLCIVRMSGGEDGGGGLQERLQLRQELENAREEIADLRELLAQQRKEYDTALAEMRAKVVCVHI